MTNAPASTRVWAKLPLHVHSYFFRHVLAGEHSAKQDITAHFYQALYDECIKRGIAPSWSPNNIDAVRNVLHNLNFDERPTDSPPAKHQTKSDDSEYDPRGTDYSGNYSA